MAAPIHGRKGRLYVGLASSTATAEPIANLRSFSLESSTDDVEVTCLGDANKKYASGLPDIGGSWSGFWDADSSLFQAATEGSPRRFYLYPTTAITTTYWFGTAIFDMSLEASVDDSVKVSGSFKAASDVSKVG
jgi:hypothetical protein